MAPIEQHGLKARIISSARALTVDEVADLFAVAPDTIYKMARRGALPAFRIATAVRFDPKALVDWLEKQ